MRSRRARRELALLLGLADGSLRGEKRAEAEQRIAATPERERALERQRVAVRELRTVAPAAPASLRARIEAETRRRAHERSRAVPRVALAGGLAAALLAVLVLVLLPLGQGPPSALAVAQLGREGPTEPAPAVDPGRRTFLEKEVEGVAFPNWTQLGWFREGASSDELDGRDVETVFYRHEGHVVAYSIVSGAPLSPPPDAVHRHINGVHLYQYRDRERDVIVFQRGGRTCVLSGAVITANTLAGLAAWDGKGTIRFDHFHA